MNANNISSCDEHVSSPSMHASGFQISQDSENEINFLDLWKILFEHKFIVLITAVLSTIISIIIAINSPIVYKAETLLTLPSGGNSSSRLSSIASQFGGLASMAGINVGKNGNAAELIAIINSRTFIVNFINEKNLQAELFPKLWDNNKKQWKQNIQPPSDLNISDAFRGKLSVKYNKKIRMIILSIRYRDPKLAAQWANNLVKRINTYLREKAIKESKDSIQFLTLQLKKTNIIELQQVLFNLIEAQTKTIMLANVREEYALKVIDPAYIPEVRLKPQKKIIVMTGAFVGLLTGIFLAFLLNFIQKLKED
jgi:uncharacterized protein involved in exopolysaccharide biosynthesis